jgi:hypothetical protein
MFIELIYIFEVIEYYFKYVWKELGQKITVKNA